MRRTKICLYCEGKELEEIEELRRKVRERVRVGTREIRRWDWGNGGKWRD